MHFFAKNLRYLRKRFDVSQETLAAAIKKSQSSIGNWENKTTEPDINDLVLISRFFDIPVETFLEVDIDKENLITEEHVKLYQKKGKLTSKPVGRGANYKKNNLPKSQVNEDEQSMMWVVMRELKELGDKIDLLQKTMERK